MTKTNGSNRTPGPWHVGLKQAEQVVYDAHGWAICNCTVFHGQESAEPKANARYIVDACNSHDTLVAALRAIIKITDGSQPIDYPGALMVARSALGVQS